MSDDAEPWPIVCVYDDPKTWRREVWWNGHRVASFCWTLFERSEVERHVPFYCPQDRFNPGQLWGDENAMKAGPKPEKAGPKPEVEKRPFRWYELKNLVAMLTVADSEPKGGTDGP